MSQKTKNANAAARKAAKAAVAAVVGEYRPRRKIKGYKPKAVGVYYRRDRNYAKHGYEYDPVSGRGIFGRARSAVRSLY